MTAPAFALYHRRPGSRRWVLFDLFPTREAAFAAVDRIPERHPAVWITEVPAPPTEGHPTKAPDPTPASP